MDRYLTIKVFSSPLGCKNDNLLVHHNSVFNLSDHLTKLISKEFKGGEAGKTFSYGITKIVALINSIGALMNETILD